jgi:beta-lactamase regulating signal transducer with metallopeptidase domain/predicted  nucleic acid-binding Zn-ribbon protein
MISSLAHSLPVLGIALLQFVWQGAVIAAVTALGLLALQNARAQARYLLACAALMLCIALPIAHIVKATGETQADSGELAVLMLSGSTSTSDKLSNSNVIKDSAFWQSAGLESALSSSVPLVVSIWALGVALMALRMGAGLLWVRQRVRHGVRQSNALWQSRLNEMARRMGIFRPIRLGVSDQIESPVTAGWWHPIIILPAALLTGMPSDLLEALLAHELGHVKRFDYLVNLLQSAIEILLFYHPAVWWLSKQIRLEREQIADDLAARLLGEPRRLALALSELEQFQFSPPQLAQAAHGGNLMSRIKHLIRPELPAKVFSWKMAIPLAGLSAACAVLYAQVGSANVDTAAAANNNVSAIPLRSAPNLTSKPTLLALNTNTDKAERKSGAASDSFALVKTSADGSDNVTTSSGFDTKDIEIFRKKSKEETLWFRDHGKSYAIRDKATLDKVKEAYKPMDELGTQMELHGKKMDEQGKVMEEIGKQMEAASDIQDQVDEAVSAAFDASMRVHEKKMEALEKKMEAAAAKLEKAHSDSARVDANHKMQEIQALMEESAQKIQKISEKFAGEQQKLTISLKPLEALGKKMEEAGKPMDKLGKEMDALGKQMDVLAKQAEKQVHELIRSAKEKGLAIPANSI